MNYVVGEKDREPYRIEGDDGSRTVRLYTEEGLNNDKIDYTFLVAYIAPYGSNSRHEHTVDELMYVASGPRPDERRRQRRTAGVGECDSCRPE